MLLIALLVAAAICLVVGMVLPSASLLVLSLVLCGVVALLLFRARMSVPAVEPDVSGGGPTVALDSSSSSVVTGVVWVVDGLPDYHGSASCPVIAGKDSLDIPRAQAVEDGFARCAVCAPAVTPAPAAAPVAPVATPVHGAADEVWVVDGRPDYHRSGCAQIAGLDAIDIPFDQAVEDGFSPCPVCSVAPAAPAAAPVAPAGAVTSAAPAASADEAWVIDGRPDYHRSGCARLRGEAAVAI